MNDLIISTLLALNQAVDIKRGRVMLLIRKVNKVS